MAADDVIVGTTAVVPVAAVSAEVVGVEALRHEALRPPWTIIVVDELAAPSDGYSALLNADSRTRPRWSQAPGRRKAIAVDCRAPPDAAPA